jgi:hypothetical protein
MSIFDDINKIIGGGTNIPIPGVPNAAPMQLPQLPSMPSLPNLAPQAPSGPTITPLIDIPPVPSAQAPTPPNAPQIGIDLGNIFGGQAPTNNANWGPPMSGPDDPDPNHRVVWEAQGKPDGSTNVASNGMKYVKNQDGTTTVFPGGEGSNPVKVDKSGNVIAENIGQRISEAVSGIGAPPDPYKEMGAKQTPANNNVPPPPAPPSQPSQPSGGGNPISNAIQGVQQGAQNSAISSAIGGMSPQQIDAIAQQYGYVKAGSQPQAAAASQPSASNFQTSATAGGNTAPKTPSAAAPQAAPTAAPAAGMAQAATADATDPSIETLIAAINGEQMQDDQGNVILDFSQLDEGLRLAIAYGIVSYAQQQSGGGAAPAQATSGLPNMSTPQQQPTASAGPSPAMQQIQSLTQPSASPSSSALGNFQQTFSNQGTPTQAPLTGNRAPTQQTQVPSNPSSSTQPKKKTTTGQ